MKNIVLYSSVLALGYFPLTAVASCEDVMAQIARKIEANDVPTSQFQLDALPNAEANEAGGQIVGSCENRTRKIIYSRKSAQVGTSEVPGTGAPEERQATPNEQSSSSDTQTALAEQTTTEEPQPEAQSSSSDQTTAEESQPEAQSSSSDQTTAEESQPEAQSSSSNQQTSTEGSQQNTSISGDLRTVEERYKFLLEGIDSDA